MCIRLASVCLIVVWMMTVYWVDLKALLDNQIENTLRPMVSTWILDSTIAYHTKQIRQNGCVFLSSVVTSLTNMQREALFERCLNGTMFNSLNITQFFK